LAGVPGTAVGVTAFETVLGALVPTLLVAVTVKVYAVPFVRPRTVMGLADPLANAPPALAWTV
jgi:hypothetical protein